jgi:cytochrome c
MRARVACLLAVLAGPTFPAVAAGGGTGGDPERGERLYSSRCFACHSVDANRVGPRHRGVFGRKAGSVPDFDYSPAVKASAIVWNEATLDRWLTNPEALIPGQKMGFRVAEERDRADLIAYLKSVSTAGGSR